MSMTLHFGLKPWDVGRLTLAQFDAYAAQIDRWASDTDR